MIWNGVKFYMKFHNNPSPGHWRVKRAHAGARASLEWPGGGVGQGYSDTRSAVLPFQRATTW